MADLLDLFRALGDPTRLRIIALLRQLELAVGELAVVLEQSQPRVSRHVRILIEAGLVDRRKEGSWVFLRLVDQGTAAALVALADSHSLSDRERAAIAHDKRRLAAVREDRMTAAARYFAQHASEWDAIRSRHADEADVEGAMLRLMHNRKLGHVLDVGTGTGRMVEIFGGAARKITALDRSPEMLRIARGKLAELRLPVELVQGDFYALPLGDASVDTVVMHQVLHFAQDPDRVIAEAARVLRGGGHLLIVDFAPHDHEELRSAAAHARLGFSDAQIRGWFASRGLISEAVQTLAADDLTVKIWLGRRRSDETSETLGSGAADPNRSKAA
jgi:ubiquinone/menaquinone biosynthesis C-methylase UbiE/DNA-binding transcriptional ArsR family regulator